MLIIPLESL